MDDERWTPGSKNSLEAARDILSHLPEHGEDREKLIAVACRYIGDPGFSPEATAVLALVLKARGDI